MMPQSSPIDRSRRIRAWSTVILSCVACGIVATIARVVQLKTEPDSRLVDAMLHDDGSPIQHLRRTEQQPRGVIFDRRGQVVALDVPAHRLYIDPRFIWIEARKEIEKVERARERALAKGRAAPDVAVSLDPIGDALASLAQRIGADPAEFSLKVLERIPADMRTIRPDAAPEDIQRIPRYVVLRDELGDGELDCLHGFRLPGIGVEDRFVRVYPFGKTAASLVGVVGTDHTGLGGLELRRDRTLDAEPGSLVRLVDNRNQTIAIPADGYRPGEAGESVQISIDMIVQQIVERYVDETVEKANAAGGRCIVVDVQTGEILAMYDALRSNTGRSPVAVDKSRAVHPAFGRNRCVTDPYEPGSTFKPFVWATATMLGKARPTDVLPTPSAGGYTVSDGKSHRLIRDVKYYGPSTWQRVLEKSMNAGMAIVAMRMSKKEMQQGIAAFGFGSKTNCGLPGETPGIVSSPKNWTMVYTQCSVAIGQEIGVTAAQMIRAFTTFCRDGTMAELTLQRLAPGIEPKATRIVPEAVALATRDAMRGVLLEGTGKRANKFAAYEVFGKSGTAQLPKPNGGGYHQDRYISSFIAGAPFDHPKIAVIVVIDDPDKHRLGYNNYGGGAIAGPTAVQIVNEVLGYMGIPPEQEIDPGSVALSN